MKEIGGYFELDTYKLPMLYEDAKLLNCGRNCLAYLIEARVIKQIYLPYFICNSVIEICKKYNVEIIFYHISNRFLPEEIQIKNNAWMYVVNYYGLVSIEEQKKIIQRYRNVIIDNSQAYFVPPIEHIDTIYTCRKYFGVSDGAILYTDANISRKLEKDKSYERVHFVLGRFEEQAGKFFHESSTNNEIFDEEPIKEMSKLTYNMLHAIDYSEIENVRSQNWRILNTKLDQINELKFGNIKGGYMYPLMIKNAGEIRRKLIERKIFIPVLWPDVLDRMPVKSMEYQFAENILPLPCDQRYNQKDMEYMLKILYDIIDINIREEL